MNQDGSTVGLHASSPRSFALVNCSIHYDFTIVAEVPMWANVAHAVLQTKVVVDVSEVASERVGYFIQVEVVEG